MTPEEINIAIANYIGAGYHKPTESELKSGCYYQYEPDYYRDLNTMHHAEKFLSQEEYENYCSELYCGQWEHDKHSDWKSKIPVYISSPSYVRAECFLKAIGKWKY